MEKDGTAKDGCRKSGRWIRFTQNLIMMSFKLCVDIDDFFEEGRKKICLISKFIHFM
jgi:hypothetical protein